MSNAIREGRWDCRQCGSRKIQGREMNCPGCGRQRPANTEFYLAEGEPEVRDPKLLERAQKGADWYCGNCQSGNQADRTTCSQCGSANGPSHELPAPAPRPVTYRRSAVPNLRAEYQPPARIAHYTPREFNPAWILAGVAAVVISIVAFMLWPRQITLQVTGFSWHREIAIQKYATVTEEGWSVPAGGRVLNSRREIRSYEKVLDHYETRTRQVPERVQVGTEEYGCGARSLGNGFFEDVKCTRPVYDNQTREEKYDEAIYRQEPIYGTRYRYEFDTWVPSRIAQAGGQRKETPAPSWPVFYLNRSGSSAIGSERESDRSEKYITSFLSREKNPETYQREVDRAAWDSYQLNGLYTAKVNRLGKLSEIRPLGSKE